MDPGILTHELAEEHGGGDHPASPPADIAHVGHVAVELLKIFFPEGHFPDPLAGLVARVLDPALERVVVPQHPDRELPQRHAAGAGQRRDVDDGGRFVPGGVGQAVCENEPPFGVGVLHLDRFARERGQDVSGFDRPPSRHVLGGGQNADQMQRKPQPGGGPDSREDFRATGHVRFHLLHVLGGLQRNAARIEGDRLSHQHDRLGVPVVPPPATVPLIFQDDELGWFVAPAGDTQERPHAQLFGIPLLQHPDTHSFLFADVSRLGRDPCRRHHVGRMIAEVTHEYGSLGGRKAASGALLDLADLRAACLHHRHALEIFRLLLVVTPIHRELVSPQHRAFHHRLGELRDGRPLQGGTVNGRVEGPGTGLTHPFGGGPHRLPDRVQARVFLFTQAHQEHTLGRYLPLGVEQGGLVALALELAAFDQILQPAVESLVHDGRLVLQGGLSFVVAHHEDLGRLALNPALLDRDIHRLHSVLPS